MKYEWTSSVSGVPLWNIPVGDDPDAVAWAKQVVINGGTVSAARQVLVGALIQALKAGGVWTKLDRLWLLAAANEPSALTDLVARGLATKVSTPAFTANQGYAGEDLVSPTKYLTLGVALNAAGLRYSLNSGHLSAWLTTNIASANGGCCIGCSDVGGNRSFLFDTFAGNIWVDINNSTAALGAPPSRQGHWIANRTDASFVYAFRNGDVFSNGAGASATVPNVTVAALADNANSVFSYGNPNTHAMVSIGAGFTTSEASLFYSALRDYMNAVGAP